MNVRLLRMSLALLLVIVKLKEVLPPACGSLVPKLLLKVAPFAWIVSVAVPLFPDEEVRSPVRLVKVAVVVAVVLTDKVQVAADETLPPV